VLSFIIPIKKQPVLRQQNRLCFTLAQEKRRPAASLGCSLLKREGRAVSDSDPGKKQFCFFPAKRS
jgi:hypothetical protein